MLWKETRVLADLETMTYFLYLPRMSMGMFAPIAYLPDRHPPREKFCLIFSILQHAAIHCTIEQQTKLPPKQQPLTYFYNLLLR